MIAIIFYLIAIFFNKLYLYLSTPNTVNLTNQQPDHEAKNNTVAKCDTLPLSSAAPEATPGGTPRSRAKKRRSPMEESDETTEERTQKTPCVDQMCHR